MEPRQSPKNPQAARLRFDSQQDALDFAGQCVEDSVRWLVHNRINFGERYTKGEVEVVVSLGIGAPLLKQYQLVAVPLWRTSTEKPERLPVADTVCSETQERVANRNGNERYMFVSVANVIEGTEKIIPSLVRLEGAQEREKLSRNILGSTIKGVLKFFGTSGEREGGVLGVPAARGDGDSVTRLIQGSPEISSGVRRDISEGCGNGLSEFNLVDLASRKMRVRIDNYGVRLLIEESADFPFEVLDVFLAPRKLAP